MCPQEKSTIKTEESKGKHITEQGNENCKLKPSTDQNSGKQRCQEKGGDFLRFLQKILPDLDNAEIHEDIMGGGFSVLFPKSPFNLSILFSYAAYISLAVL
jgi:hypothetical protein